MSNTGFTNGGQIPAYGNEKSSAQVIQELKEERDFYKSQNARMREALREAMALLEDEGYDVDWLISIAEEALQQEGGEK